MRRRVEQIPEPRTGADGCGDTERTVLGELEDLEVVENDRLGQGRTQRRESHRLKQKRMAAETRTEAGDRGRRAAQGPGNLTMGGPGLQ